MDQNLKSQIGFSSTGIIGPARLNKLLSHFGSAADAWRATRRDFINAGIEEGVAEELEEKIKKIDIDKIINVLDKENIKVLIKDDPFFPKLLHETYPAPTILFYKGEMQSDEFALAVVGARRATDYAKCVVPIFINALVGAGITIASGLALGVDTIAHQATLIARGRTIGVLAGGLDRGTIYPPENKDLVDKIIDSSGCVFSEYAPYILPMKQNFPARNRLIAGVSRGVLVVEAKETSGALITAKFGLEQGKEVFAIPGSILNQNSGGTNNLIKQGAKLVTEPKDIFEEFNIAFEKPQVNVEPETEEERKVLSAFCSEPMFVDEIALATNINMAQLNSVLMMMAIKGMIKNLDNGKYVKIG